MITTLLTRRVAGAAVLVVLIAGCSACDPRPPLQPAPSSTTSPTTTTEAVLRPATGYPDIPGPRVAVVGDSLVACCVDAWAEEAAVWAYGMTKLPTAVRWLKSLTPPPDVVVVGQGTNNARDGWDRADRDALSATIDAVPGACVVLVNLGWSKQAASAYKAGAVAANQDMASRPGVRVANWRGWSAYSDWFDTDGIHHTAEGSERYRVVVMDAVDRCP